MKATGIIICGLCLGLAAGCDKGDDDDSAAVDHYPELFCPGDPSGICDPSDDLTLYAGAAAVKITPACWEHWIDVNDSNDYGSSQGDTYFDCGCDRLCPEDDGYPGPDEGEGDGVFQTEYLAGGGHARCMNEVHDDIWARAIVLSQGDTTLAILSADIVGYFRGTTKAIEEVVAASSGVDYLVWSSTHNHHGPDTMGIWGSGYTSSGFREPYITQLREAGIQAIEEAADQMVPVDVVAAEYVVQDEDCEGQGINNFNMDTRDPQIVNPRIFSVQFVEEGSGDTVATILNNPNHPESVMNDNVLTSGFPHYWRDGVENGVETSDGPVDGIGGVAIYFQGMCGGMQTTLRVEPYDLMGELHEHPRDFDSIKAIGDYYAYFSLTSLAEGEFLDDPALSFRIKEFDAPVENILYLMMFNAGVLTMDQFPDFLIPDPDDLLTEDNVPIVTTEVGVLELGPIQIVTIPGEMLPENILGGYDGSLTGPLRPLVDEGNSNPPAMDLAPEPPYFIDDMTGTYKMFFGLSNDELGYMIAPFNYELGPSPYMTEPEGDHYEETNSTGPNMTTIVMDTLQTLLAWQFPQ